MANNMFVAAAVRSSCVGSSVGSRHALAARVPAHAIAAPAAPPHSERRIDSVSSCRAIRIRPAPTAVRNTISRVRSLPRASSSPARFEHPASINSAPSPKSAQAKARAGAPSMSPNIPGRVRRAESGPLRRCSLLSSVTTVRICASLASRDLPRAIRASVNTFWVARLFSHELPTSISACIVIGTQISGR